MTFQCSADVAAKNGAQSVERIAFVLIDGLADIHIPALANLTPLEAADTPTMDEVAGVDTVFLFVWKVIPDLLHFCSCRTERSA